MPRHSSQSEREPLDLGQQLEALLLAIEETEPGLLSNAGVVKPPGDHKPPPQQAAKTAEHIVPTAPESTPVPQPVAVEHTSEAEESPVQAAMQQTTSLVDHRPSTDGPEDGGSGPGADLPIEDAGASVDRLGQQLNDLLDEARGVAASSASAASPAPAGNDANDPDDAATQEVIHQIDELLASGAEQAVEDTFDTSAAILGDEQVPPAAAQNAPTVAAAFTDSGPAPTAAKHGDSREDFDIARHVAGDEEAAGDDAPEDGPTPADIARELDEQPEHAAPPLAHAATTTAPHPPHAATSRGEHAAAADGSCPTSPGTAVNRPGRGRWSGRLYHACAVVNRPLRLVSSDIRRGIGYAALLLLFNGVVLTLFGIIRVIAG